MFAKIDMNQTEKLEKNPNPKFHFMVRINVNGQQHFATVGANDGNEMNQRIFAHFGFSNVSTIITDEIVEVR